MKENRAHPELVTGRLDHATGRTSFALWCPSCGVVVLAWCLTANADAYERHGPFGDCRVCGTRLVWRPEAP